MTCIHSTFAIGVKAEPWSTDNEEMLLSLLNSAEMSFDRLEADRKGLAGDFRKHFAALEDMIVTRMARRAAEAPRRRYEDDLDRQLRALHAGQKRARLEAHLTVFAVIGISIVAAVAATLRFSGAGL